MLIQVDAPHFCAGLVIERSSAHDTPICVEAAPILRWAIGKSEDFLRDYFRRKGWKATRAGD